MNLALAALLITHLTLHAYSEAADARLQPATQDELEMLGLYGAYSGAAYLIKDRWDCEPACKHPGTEGTVVEHNWDVGFPRSTGYIARNPAQRVIVVAFQGTNEIGQWIDDLDIVQDRWPESVRGSYVHRGFLRGYNSARDGILKTVERLAASYPTHSIAIVGHSLGGARATICLLDLSIQLPHLTSRLNLYTHGQPRVGNLQFAQAVNKVPVPMYREVFEYDIVPRIPPTLMGYVHHHMEAWVHNNQTMLCYNPPKSDGCAGDGSFEHPLSISDHYLYPGLRHY
ncbi:alpha/beta-hydrolase [Martensiomyces pterosporus]|nr:alpha/beta-hydrolase [Martensiomyces pterosporus]